jgi:D-serine deaminase-like pyridoxal phosphate-dependent protein
VQGEAPPDDLIVISANQEHGVLASRQRGDLDLSRYPVGTLLRILPNHACATAAAHDRYHVVSGKEPRVLKTWPRFSGW